VIQMEKQTDENHVQSPNVATACDMGGQSPEGRDQKDCKTNVTINPNLNREVHSPAKMAGYCSLMLATEVSKQITSYGMKYYNGGTYPLPQTEIVALAELLKFIIFLSLTAMSYSGLQHMKISLWYAIPSVIYVVNNNVFYLALNYTTPPVWNILIQLRVILTALTYRLFFHRTVTVVQWIALALLITAIGLSNWNEISADSKHHTHLTVAVVLAAFGSVTSVIGTLVMEVKSALLLLKITGLTHCLLVRVFIKSSIEDLLSSYVSLCCSKQFSVPSLRF
jgi:drug/metabolite transporter (DMT)-like permease